MNILTGDLSWKLPLAVFSGWEWLGGKFLPYLSCIVQNAEENMENEGSMPRENEDGDAVDTEKAFHDVDDRVDDCDRFQVAVSIQYKSFIQTLLM